LTEATVGIILSIVSGRLRLVMIKGNIRLVASSGSLGLQTGSMWPSGKGKAKKKENLLALYFGYQKENHLLAL
jgi:hypothetical protein